MEHTGRLREVGSAFARQAEPFAANEIANSEQLMNVLLNAAQPARGERGLDACGLGIVARALAGRGAEVLGVDATAAPE